MSITASKRKRIADPQDPHFARFWAAYPRKKDKIDARRQWVKAIEQADPEVIIAGAERFALEPRDPDPRFTKLPATWLSKGSWDNEPETAGDDTPQEGGTW